jgi:membrane-associated protease RseP (regulator of RpoE activity)
MAPVPRAEVKAEESTQRELVLVELAKAQERLDNIAYPLLAAAGPMCSSKTGWRLGFYSRSAQDYKGDWAPRAVAALQLSDTTTITHIVASSPAGRAGLQKGDRIVSVAGTPIPAGREGREALSKALARVSKEPVEVAVRRADGAHNLTVQPELVCDLGATVIVEGDINAYADGKNVFFAWAMMRFANDDELRAVVSHEIAHNAMGHIEARKKNSMLAGVFGAIADVALATQGYNTGGQNTMALMRLGAMAYSQDFEREADYVGLYIMARAGVPLNGGLNLWRQFAQINPSAIGYASTHPTTAERFVRLKTAMQEIDAKRVAGKDLLPDMKAERNAQ